MKSAPTWTCVPSCSGVKDLPISWNKQPSLTIFRSAPISRAIAIPIFVSSRVWSQRFCPYENLHLNLPNASIISRGKLCTPTSLASFSPSSRRIFSNSLFTLVITSSILDGCILPSAIRRSRATFATSLRSPSKDERRMTPWSSKSISTPEAASKAFIFLPSFPIIRPFMSSSSNFIVVVVYSAT